VACALTCRGRIDRCRRAYSLLGVTITAWGQFAGTWNALGWSSIISYLIFALGYWYFLFFKSE
jgi:hypothetical protein